MMDQLTRDWSVVIMNGLAAGLSLSGGYREIFHMGVREMDGVGGSRCRADG